MKTFKELIEAVETVGHLTFGRFNPPTVGHAKLVDHVLAQKGGKKRIIISHSQDNKKNPLSGEEKSGYLQKMYPDNKDSFEVSSKESPTIFHHAAKMYKEGIHHLHVHVGEDRVEEFKKKLNAYNGKFDDKGNGFKFKSITVHSAGARDPDAEGTEGMSATKMREAAISGDKKTFKSGLHPALHPHVAEMMDKIKSRISSANESFMIGDYVTNGIIEGEILNLHPTYATLVSEGNEHRVWAKDLSYSDNQPKRNQLYKESLIFKSYKTKNFTRPLAESFKEISLHEDDDYAMLECIKVLDYILSVTDKTITENFKTVRIQTERLKRYSKKVGAQYLTDSIISAVEEELLKYAILEDLRFSSTDQVMIAKVIAMVANTSINNADPVNIVNNAAQSLRNSQLTTQGWIMLGRLFNVATKAGIRWQKDIFSNSIKGEMRLI